MSARGWQGLLLGSCQLLILLSWSGQAHAGSSKVLLYHHVSDRTPPATSVRPKVFESHLKLIEESGYQVVALQQIVDRLVNGEELDDRWVAITFDDAYDSLATTAAPRLRERHWPFTVFVSINDVDSGHHPYLDWDALRALEAAGASIGNHGVSHAHMARRLPGEDEDAWGARQLHEVITAQERLERELAAPLRLFAYPYGEFDADTASLMRSLGFIAFGQQSGPVGRATNPYAIPRFPLGTGFDSVTALAEKLRTVDLPLEAPRLPVTVLPAAAAPPLLELTLGTGSGVRQGSMTCFVAGQPSTEVEWRGDREIRVRAERSLPPGRSRYTCTAPAPHRPGAYYWYSHLFIAPRDDGTWPDE